MYVKSVSDFIRPQTESITFWYTLKVRVLLEHKFYMHRDPLEPQRPQQMTLHRRSYRPTIDNTQLLLHNRMKVTQQIFN